ncbi:MAG TPA: hypothetical protein VF245_09605 [Solirubrobacterales bacterium]
MKIVSLVEHLKEATSLPEIASRLGAAYLECAGQIDEALEDPDAHEEFERLETAVAVTPLSLWEEREGGGGLVHVLDHGGLRECIELVEANMPLEHLAVLRGLCAKPLREFYEAVETPVLLDRGMPVLLADRPPLGGSRRSAAEGGERDDSERTPHYRTLGNGQALTELPFRLYNRSAGDHVRVELDFRHRAQIDQLTWLNEKGLPKIATMHPVVDSSTYGIEPIGDSQFFDVTPKCWDLEETAGQLRRIAADGIEVAVLPELCLPSPDALEQTLAECPEEFPALVVAGSAHLREPNPSRTKEIRANESRVYLRGERVAVHRKFHPVKFEELGGFKFDRKREEALTREPKTITVLAGERTHLAVLICADLNDDRIPEILISAGINLLLVPSLTPHPGSFNGAICDVACYSQGVAAVVNAELNGADPDREGPFFAMAAVPRSKARSQSEEFRPDPDAARPAIGVIDLNRPLSAAVSWM